MQLTYVLPYSSMVETRRCLGVLCWRTRPRTARRMGMLEIIKSPSRDLSEYRDRRIMRLSLQRRSAIGCRANAQESIQSMLSLRNIVRMFSSSSRTPGEYLENVSSKAILKAKPHRLVNRLCFKAIGTPLQSSWSNITHFSAKPARVMARKNEASCSVDLNAPPPGAPFHPLDSTVRKASIQ